MKNKYYDTQKNFDVVWQASLIQGEKIVFSCYSPFEKNKKIKFNIRINISKIKTLAINYFNFTAKVFFCDVLKFVHLVSGILIQGVFKLTCPKSAERLSNAGFKFRIIFKQEEFALSGDRVSGVYIYGAGLD